MQFSHLETNLSLKILFGSIKRPASFFKILRSVGKTKRKLDSAERDQRRLAFRPVNF